MTRNRHQKHLKNSRLLVAMLVAFLLFTVNAFAQEAASDTDKPWGIGTSITYPINDIYMIQSSYSPCGHGDLLLGAAFQNWENDQGQANAYTLLLGYRKYLWRGLHAEMELWPAYNPFESSVDGKTYKGMELWASLRIGYKFDFKAIGNDFYILAQPSIGLGVLRGNKWPDMEKDDDAVFEPQVILGVKL